ncbi:hypothetical protein [Dapis sp. BLCC M229]
MSNTISQKSCYISLKVESRESGVGSRIKKDNISLLFAYNR